MPKAQDTLSQVFGFDAFRPGQAEIVQAVTTGQNVLAIMPTGGGKSLCYQLPALLRDGVTVVISPLIALMLRYQQFVSGYPDFSLNQVSVQVCGLPEIRHRLASTAQISGMLQVSKHRHLWSFLY